MTTQELKNKIEKVLGNSIRCLLPSYWWKNLFHSVADRIDEVEQSTSQLIDSKVNKVLKEAKMPIVESVDELSKLDLPKGGVAAVEKVGEPVVVNLEDCYLSADAATDWDKYTVIRGFSEKGAPSNAVGQIHLYSDKSMENGLTIACGEGKYFYYKIVNGRRYDSSLEEVNKYLASGEYRLVFGYYIENVSAYVTLYSAFPQPSLYIKGDSWERLAKESDITGEGGNTSGDGLIFGKERYAYVSRHKDVNGNITELGLSEEQRTYNQETNEMLKSGEKVYLSYEGTFWMQVGYSQANSDYTFYFSTASMVLPYDNKVFGRLMVLSSDGSIDLIDTLIGGTSGDITIDDAMSDTSENSVQNKVIKKYIDDNLSEAEEVHAAALNDLNERKADKEYVENALKNIATSDLASKKELQNLTDEIIANEQVHAAALNDLNERLNNVGGGSSGGNGVLRVWANELIGGTNTDAQIAENVATFNAITRGSFAAVSICAKDETDQIGVVYNTSMMEFSLDMVGMIHNSISVIEGTMEPTSIIVELSPDGSVAVQQ